MFGRFQQTHLRIEVEASESTIRRCLMRPDQVQQWLLPFRASEDLPDEWQIGSIFTSWVGPIPIDHQVTAINPNTLELLLSQGIDGYHHWHWGDGWLQSCVEGISLLPLNLGQTASLLSLKRHLIEIERNTAKAA